LPEGKEVDIDAGALQKLVAAVGEFGEAYKAHNKLTPHSKEDKAKETPEAKVLRMAAHSTMQAKAHLVKEAEIHGFPGLTQQATMVANDQAGTPKIFSKKKNKGKK
jgi:hypothetical protein